MRALRRWIIGTVAICAASLSFAQTVSNVSVSKEQAFDQNSATTIVRSSTGYRFFARVNGPNLGSITPPVVSGPLGNGQLVFDGGSEWRFGGEGHATQAELDALYGNGLYTITVNGTAVSLNLTGDQYPNAPQMTLSGGVWSGSTYVIDPSQALTITSNAFTSYGSHADDVIHMYVGNGVDPNVGNLTQSHSTTPGSNAGTLTIPPNTLVNGQRYYAATNFAAWVDINHAALPSSTNVAWYDSVTNLPVLAVSGTLAPPSQVSGSLSGSSTSGDSVQISFTCSGTPTCTGTYQSVFHNHHCSNPLAISDTLTITGFDLSQAGSLLGNITFADADVDGTLNPDGSCSLSQATPARNVTRAYTGTWNGNIGTIATTLGDSDGLTYQVTGDFSAGSRAAVNTIPVFPMVVSANIATSANVTATIQPRPQDVGTTQSIFVFFVAPSNLVQGASLTKSTATHVTPKNAPKDSPIQCVLAQLNAQGQLVGVNSANLLPYLTTVLGAQNQAVNVLTNVPTSNVAGSTPYVGYGKDAQSMYNSGVNQSTGTIPGSVTCKPEAPQTGWWWNPKEDGRGYSIEVRANRYVFASFLYDVSGRATWLVSTGEGASLDGSLIQGRLLSAKGGQTLGGAYPGFPPLKDEGAVTLAFNDASHGTMVWPGGSVPIERFNIVPTGLTLAPLDSQPENGWWWNADESGRGFFLEWQGGVLDIAGYMYDDNGDPIWYLSENLTPSTNLQQFSSNWWQYADGMTLAGPWKPNRQVTDHLAPVTIQFSGVDTALMTLPNGRTTRLVRQRF